MTLASLSVTLKLSTIMASLRRRSDTCPCSICGGPPIRVSSSRPTTLHVWKVPLGSLAFNSPLYMGTAHATPSTPRTLSTSVSFSGLRSSMYCTFGSITQISGSVVSVRNPNVRVISPRNIADCWVMSSDANVNPMTMPRYLARSPISIFKAMKFISSSTPTGF